jgi:negative regulator of flagellin synthesis FlgM
MASPRPVAANLPASLSEGSGSPALKGLVRDLASRPPVDTARVDALRTALGSGTYRLDPERVADAMIASLRSGG